MTHLTVEDWVGYFAGDHPGEDDLEEHLMGCESCAREGARIAAITEGVRALIPVVVDRAAAERLRAKGLRLRENPVDPGVPNEVVFANDTDIVLHTLRGLDLRGATRVSLRVSVESDGSTLIVLPSTPFDRESGELLIACQRHFAMFPPDTLMEVHVESEGGTQTERYSILHHFAL
ncbi:MAG: hypothetical protein ACXWUG_01040 [Polyangiales bacterium]